MGAKTLKIASGANDGANAGVVRPALPDERPVPGLAVLQQRCGCARMMADGEVVATCPEHAAARERWDGA